MSVSPHAPGAPLIELDIPASLDRDLYDQRMAEGWFRSGPILCRANVLCLDERIRGLSQIRLPLDAPNSASRSARRRFRRNRDRFRVEFGRARVDSAREALYEKTKPRFMSFVSSELAPLVFGEDASLQDTRECAVYDGERLVAVSYFDVGREAVASQLALHDPDYAAYGLGTYTLLEEVEYARQIGARYLYPGYVVPGLPSFDYKMQIGRVQFLEGRTWRRRATPPRRVREADRFIRRMQRFEHALAARSLPVERKFYAGFWLSLVPHFRDHDFASGLVVWTLDTEPDGHRLVAQLTLGETAFRLVNAATLEAIDLMEGYDPLGAVASHYETHALTEQLVLDVSDDPMEIADAAARTLHAPFR